MKNKIAILLLACFAWGATVLAFTTYEKAKTAFARGKQVQYMELFSTIETVNEKTKRFTTDIEKLLANIEYPEKLNTRLKGQANSKGEEHPIVIDSGSLKNFIFNNCSRATFAVAEEVQAYATAKGIKPEIVFAIAWADSRCGQDMTTPNNPGNVGNNDRGNRVGHFELIDGWKAIVDTLNNQYMKGLTMVGQLSQGGRTGTILFKGLGAKYSCTDAPAPWKCYATSTENHYNNTIRALIGMGLMPGPDWTFRL